MTGFVLLFCIVVNTYLEKNFYYSSLVKLALFDQVRNIIRKHRQLDKKAVLSEVFRVITAYRVLTTLTVTIIKLPTCTRVGIRTVQVHSVISVRYSCSLVIVYKENKTS